MTQEAGSLGSKRLAMPAIGLLLFLVVRRLERSPKFVRKQQAEWLAAARRLLNA